jgi:hypothetical protein
MQKCSQSLSAILLIVKTKTRNILIDSLDSNLTGNYEGLDHRILWLGENQ